MRKLQKVGHRALNAFHLPTAVKEAALELQHRFAVLLVYLSADDEQSIRIPRRHVPGAVAAAEHDIGGRLVDDLKMVCQLGARFVSRCAQLLGSPQLLGRGGALVFPGEVSSLGPVACGWRTLLAGYNNFPIAFCRQTALTKPSPDAATELEHKISLLLKQLGLDLI